MKDPLLPYILGVIAAQNMTGSDLRETKRPQKCGLKACTRMTEHNGGYCCSEHCKLDRERRKKGKR